MKYRVFWINFGWFSQDQFNTFEEAVAYGKSKAMEFNVYDPLNSIVASWTTFGGLKDRRFREVRCA
jgi:hypothetical protein